MPQRLLKTHTYWHLALKGHTTSGMVVLYVPFFEGGDSLILLNDKEVSFVEGENLRDFLLRNAYDPDFLACEVDEKLVKKDDFDEFIMEDESRVEVFSFVGGG